MFDRALNLCVVFYGIAILKIAFVEDLFISKLQVVCLQHYCEGSVTDYFFEYLNG